MNSYHRLLFFVKPYIPRLIFAIVCMILAALAYLLVPWLIKDVVDKVLAERDLVMLNFIVVGIVVLFLGRGFCVYGQTYLMSYIGQRVIIDIRETVYRHLQRLSLSYFDKRKTGVIMSNLTNDVTALQTAIVDNLVSFITEGVTLVGSLASMLYLDWKLTFLTLVIVPLVLLINNIFGNRLRVAGRDVQGRIADITSLLQESISGVRVVRSFVRESYEMKRFGEENRRNFYAVLRATKLTSLLTPSVEFAASLAISAILWYGGYAVVMGETSAGELIAFLIYAINLSNPVKRISQVYGNVQKSMAAAERIFQILDTEPEIKEKNDAKVLSEVEGRVDFKNVYFSYDHEKIALHDLSISIPAGKTVAIVGPSGAGKTTIANLIPRFYDVNSGGIFIDDVNIKDVTFASLREQIGIVPQETMLFNTTVRQNVLYGRLDATEEEVIEALKAANAWEFVAIMQDGLDTVVGEKGNSLSGGQRQRIAIARAILKNPRILILDEATSALDTESEKLVQEALDRLMKERTAIVIAHRLSTIKKADLILVLQNGALVEQGSHDELLEADGLYAYLHSVQFNDSKE